MKRTLAQRLRRWLKGSPPRVGPPQRFVILAMQRTGSTMVVSALNSHPAIFCHRELFRADAAATGRLRDLDAVDARFHDSAFRTAHPEDYLEAIYGMDYRASFVGFKLLLPQHPTMRDRLIEDGRYRKVLLRRDNVLARYASESLLYATRGSSVQEDGKVEFVERDFLKYRRRHHRLFDETLRRLEQAGQPFLDISYAEACTTSGLRRIVTALGADASVDLQVTMARTGSPDIVSRFSNPAQVEDFLARNRLEHWRFEDPA